MTEEFDLRKQQEEAVRRAREMQARARFPISRQQNRRPSQAESAPLEETPQEKVTPQQETFSRQEVPSRQEEPSRQEASSREKPISVLDTLLQDRERTLILALLILLGEDDKHTELLFALLFLLL